VITMNNIDKMAKIYVAGHRGMVGSSIVRALEKKGYQNILKRTHAQLDLTSQKEVRDFFYQELPRNKSLVTFVLYAASRTLVWIIRFE